MVGVGESGGEFARFLNPEGDRVRVLTTVFDIKRENRSLTAERKSFGFRPILIDDVAVSGLTLRVVRNALASNAEAAGIGLLNGSKTTQLRTGIDDIRAVITYSRENGGTPPINSWSKLKEDPVRLSQLADRYFEGSKAFQQLIRGEE